VQFCPAYPDTKYIFYIPNHSTKSTNYGYQKGPLSILLVEDTDKDNKDIKGIQKEGNKWIINP
jgi:hypothetical protein